MNQLLCTCGYQAEDAADLATHFGEMFIPHDDVAPDGQVHAENARDADDSTPVPATLSCRCGITTSFDDFDQHLLDVFAPADRVGLDGHKHAPAD
jgi:hypothetical protein